MSAGSVADDLKLQLSAERHRFLLAVLIVTGFFTVLLAAMYKEYSDPSTLAGIFSGWIVAIIGFYFLDTAANRTQQQATIITSKAEEKSARISKTGQEETDQIAKEAKDRIDKLESEKKVLAALAEEYRKKVRDMVSESEKAPK